MNTLFTSTRSNLTSSASQAILKGISDEGGLFVPNSFPRVNIEEFVTKNYQDICFTILSAFLSDFEQDTLKEIIKKAYEKFSVEEVAPVVSLENHHVLELFHGPTLAFKDVALSILPYLITESARIQEVSDEIVILTATSGDTGKAALEGFANVKNTKIVVFYPSEGVSEIQKKQMTSQEGDNVFVLGIKGNFDDAQNGVKEIFNDLAFKNDLKAKDVILSSANSINIGRLLPQIVYYFSSYIALVNKGSISMNEEINFTVPTGNFGDILAGYYAKEMGLPISKLICASNSNNVLYDFFKTGAYNKNREFVKTISPSMDILISSNFERLLYHMSNNDEQLISSLMNQLNKEGSYTVPLEMKNKIDDLFYGSFCDEETTKSTIKEVYAKYGYVLDTHTAVAYKAHEDYSLETGDTRANVILSTASPFKFTKSVYEAIFGESTIDEFALIKELSKETNLTIPESIKNIKELAVLHKNVIPASTMKNIVKEILL